MEKTNRFVLFERKRKPTPGLIATVYLLALVWAVQTLFIGFLGMPSVEYMIRVLVIFVVSGFLGFWPQVRNQELAYAATEEKQA